jgi:hypothetical protein
VLGAAVRPSARRASAPVTVKAGVGPAKCCEDARVRGLDTPSSRYSFVPNGLAGLSRHRKARGEQVACLSQHHSRLVAFCAHNENTARRDLFEC